VFDSFTKLSAQVTNPPLDAIREELVTSLGTNIGPEQNLLDPSPASCRQVTLPFPVIGEQDLAKLVHINDDGNMPGLATDVVDGRFDPAGGGDGLRARLGKICAEVSEAIERGARLIVLSDRGPAGSASGPATATTDHVRGAEGAVPGLRSGEGVMGGGLPHDLGGHR